MRFSWNFLSGVYMITKLAFRKKHESIIQKYIKKKYAQNGSLWNHWYNVSSIAKRAIKWTSLVPVAWVVINRTNLKLSDWQETVIYCVKSLWKVRQYYLYFVSFILMFFSRFLFSRANIKRCGFNGKILLLWNYQFIHKGSFQRLLTYVAIWWPADNFPC